MKIVHTYTPCIASIGTHGGIEEKRTKELMAVLTQDESGLYAAYIGLVPSPDRGCTADDRAALAKLNAINVARLGNKLPYRDLASYFRGIKEEEYRR